MSVQKVEVMVVGAGPAGSTTALLLARQGRDVLLVDQAGFPRDKPCGEYLNPAAVAILRRLGLEPALRGAGARTVIGACLTSPSGRSVRVRYPSSAEPPPYGLSIPRVALDGILRQAAEAAGARVREGFRVDDVLRSPRRVSGVVGRSARGREEVQAAFIVAADGSRSVIGRRLGLALPPGAPRRFGLVAHYADVQGDDWVEMHAGRRGYCGLGFSAGGGANVAMVAEAADLPRLQGRAEAFYEERLAEFPSVHRRLAAGMRVGPVMVTGSMSARTSRVCVPGALLVGDASGFYDPYTGEGISYALRAAELAAQAIDTALTHEGTLSDAAQAAALRSYESRRRAAFAGRILTSRVIQAVLRRPVLLEAVFSRFEADPALARRLVGVTAGILPASDVLSPAYLTALLSPPRMPVHRRTLSRPCPDVWTEPTDPSPSRVTTQIP
jgi:geranylgeranyl reductase family protein